MNIDFKLAMGALSVAIATVAYSIMLWGIYRQNKHPSPISWFGFGFCTTVGFLVQVWGAANAGSWVMGWTAFCCFVVAFASWATGGIELTRLDKVTFGLGMFCFAAWLVCYFDDRDQTIAAILATASDLFLYGPSIRNGWQDPDKENASGYALNSIKFVPSLLALGSFSLATMLYPASLVLANGGMNVMLTARSVHLALKRGVYDKLWQVIDAHLPLVAIACAAVTYTTLRHVSYTPLIALFAGMLAYGLPFTTLRLIRSKIGSPYWESKQRGKVPNISEEASREALRVFELSFFDELVNLHMLLVLIMGAVVEMTPGVKNAHAVALVMSGMCLLILSVFSVMVFRFLFIGRWGWILPKTLTTLAMPAGYYLDLYGHPIVGAVSFASLILCQQVLTLYTWPHRQVDLRNYDWGKYLRPASEEAPRPYGGSIMR